MTAAAGIVVGAVTAELLSTRHPRWAALAGAAAGLAVWRSVWMLGVALAAGLAAAVRALRARKEARLATEGDLTVLAELTHLGLVAGLAFGAALQAAAAEAGPELRREVAVVLARARVAGQAPAFAAAQGRTAPLCRLAARALVTGAPLGESLASFVAAARDRDRARRLAATQRLPVRLLVPLTLLILPGFVVLTAGPALLDGLGRLGV